ncbi:Uncharacterised protein [Bordetella pertussis]|nr:Uncharacterised protein [Bordetella pertussis]
MDSMCWASRPWKTTTSSIRFRNSGRNVCLSSSHTTSLMTSYGLPAMLCMCCDPRLDVMTMTVLRKSTVRP